MCRLNPRVDFAFKKLFGSEENKDLLISLINSIVSENDQITDIRLINPYNAKNFGKDKLSILDIKGLSCAGTWYNIEMQITDQEYYDKRALYYWSRLYNSQLKEGINYDKLNKTICINILNFDCLDEIHFHNIYKLLNLETGNELIDHMEIHFIELNKYNGDLSETKTALERWITFLTKAHEYSSHKLPKALREDLTIKRAIDILTTIALTDKERDVYEARLKWLRDEEMALVTAHKKGLKEGLKEGLKQGREEGIALGFEQAITKLIASGMTETEARKILGEG